MSLKGKAMVGVRGKARQGKSSGVAMAEMDSLMIRKVPS